MLNNSAYSLFYFNVVKMLVLLFLSMCKIGIKYLPFANKNIIFAQVGNIKSNNYGGEI